MTARSKSAIKAFFVTGAFPTQSNFGDFIDSYQDINTTLTVLASATTGTVGLQLLSCNTSASAQNAMGLKFMATVSSVGTNNLDNLAVTQAKIANNAVDTAQLATTTVVAGSYTNLSATIGVDGRITSASNSTSAKIAQVVSTETGAVSSGTTQIPYDDSIPQNTEGDQYLSLSITPTSASSTLYITVSVNYGNGTNNQMTVALFQDSTASAIAAIPDYITSTSGTNNTSFTHKMTAGTTSSTTFSVRIGCGAAGTTTLNGQGGARKYGGVAVSSMVITEVLP